MAAPGRSTITTTAAAAAPSSAARRAGRQYHHHRCMQWLPGASQPQTQRAGPARAVLGQCKAIRRQRDQIQIDQTTIMHAVKLAPTTPPTHHCQPRHVRFREEMTRAAVSRSIGCYSTFLPFLFHTVPILAMRRRPTVPRAPCAHLPAAGGSRDRSGRCSGCIDTDERRHDAGLFILKWTSGRSSDLIFRPSHAGALPPPIQFI
jgi:hypothetical protein